MIGKLKYPALNAKMKCMHANELTVVELEELSRQPNLKEAIYFLKMKFPNLDNIDEGMHRKELEQELNNIFIFNILKLIKYLNKSERKIFMQFLAKYEINCVKNVYRNVVTNRDTKTNLRNIDNWTNNLFKNITGINEITDLEEFYEIIKSQDYYDIYEQYEKIVENIPIEEIEVKLDQMYFTNIYNLAKGINNEFEKMIGTEIDLLNITWIYRAKKYFKYNENEIRNVLIPVNYRISKIKMNKLLDCANFDEMKQVLEDTVYRKVFDDNRMIEYDKNKYLYDLYMKLFRTKLFNICTVFCDINLTDIQIKNIVNIIEGIRYDIDRQEIQKRIIY